MKRVEIHVYNFSELSNSAKEEVIQREIDSQNDLFWSHYYFEEIQAFIEDLQNNGLVLSENAAERFTAEGFKNSWLNDIFIRSLSKYIEYLGFSEKDVKFIEKLENHPRNCFDITFSGRKLKVDLYQDHKRINAKILDIVERLEDYLHQEFDIFSKQLKKYYHNSIDAKAIENDLLNNTEHFYYDDGTFYYE